MLSKKMEQEINNQVNREMYSAYLYMAMSAYSSGLGYKGMAVWLMAQYHEEMFHAMKFYEYVLRQGGCVKLDAIAGPDREFGTPLQIFERVLEHEKSVTRNINDLMDLATAEKDHASQAFIAWYVTEQVEEEENATDIIQQLRMVGENRGALFMFDKELGSRTVTIPTDFSRGTAAAANGNAQA